MTKKVISIELPTDEDGHLPRQCPHCEQQFSIHGDTYQEEHYLNLRCPYCGWIEEFDQFPTEEQAGYTEVTAENEAREMVAEELQDAIDDIFGGSSSGSIDFGERDTPSPHLPFKTNRQSCPECGFGYGVIEEQSEVMCPVCR